jgi:hypothetical protein
MIAGTGLIAMSSDVQWRRKKGVSSVGGNESPLLYKAIWATSFDRQDTNSR